MLTDLRVSIKLINHRNLSIVIRQTRTASVNLTCGIPQGSVLGPVLYMFYTNPLENLIQIYEISHHVSADDTQLTVFILAAPTKQR